MFYGLFGQLVREDNAADNRTYVWEYDGNGNILNKKEYAFTTESTLGTVLNTVSYGYNESNWKDLLTSYNGVTISSDLSGNPLNWRNASSLTWSGRKLTGLTLTDSTAVSYTYNADGIRTEKTVGTRHTEYLLDGTKVLKQITTDASSNTTEQILFYYDTNEELVGFHYDLHDYWYGKDINGVIRYIYNENGEMCAEYIYDAWGRVISSSNLNGGTVVNINPFRYKSYYYDTETGFYYLQSRYYDPTIARFISADSVDFLGASGSVLSYNLFAYCENEPVQSCDPSGHVASTVIKFFAGMILGIFYQIVADIIESILKIIVGKGNDIEFNPISDYVESMLTWGANTLNIFNRKLAAFLLPIGIVATKYLVKIITGDFKTLKINKIITDVAVAILNGIINVCFTNQLQSKINKIRKSYLNNKMTYFKMVTKTKKMNISMNNKFFNFSATFTFSSTLFKMIFDLIFDGRVKI